MTIYNLITTDAVQAFLESQGYKWNKQYKTGNEVVYSNATCFSDISSQTFIKKLNVVRPSGKKGDIIVNITPLTFNIYKEMPKNIKTTKKYYKYKNLTRSWRAFLKETYGETYTSLALVKTTTPER